MAISTTTSTLAPPAANTSKRDYLIALEGAAQKKWAEAKLFETDSPYATGEEAVPTTAGVKDFITSAALVKETRPKWFGTFPYPVRCFFPRPHHSSSEYVTPC